jgi:hypothetical protein
MGDRAAPVVWEEPRMGLGKAFVALSTLLVAAGVSLAGVPAEEASAAARASVDIRVATYNVRSVSLDRTHGEERPWRERRA